MGEAAGKAASPYVKTVIIDVVGSLKNRRMKSQA
jgi:hypothetical protein